MLTKQQNVLQFKNAEFITYIRWDLHQEVEINVMKVHICEVSVSLVIHLHTFKINCVFSAS
jgi:hypothetical protein